MDSELAKRPHSTPKRSVEDSNTQRKSGSCLDESYSFNSTGDSTRSLLSVLSHSSVESISEHEISDKVEHDKNDDRRDEIKRTDSKVRSLTASPDNVAEELDSKLNVFEKWLVKKIKEERKAIKKQIKKEEEAKRQKQEQENEKKERQKMIEQRIEAWVLEHNTQDKYRRRVKIREEKMKQEMKEEEKRRTEEKEKACREEWLAKKKEEQRLKAMKEKEEKEKKTREEIERKEKAQAIYEEWYKNSIQKPRKVKNSYAYSEGTLKGYYDYAAYPLPSYCNPIPWKPIPVPQEADDIPSAKSRRHGKKKRLQDPSPPLLFKARTAKENIVAFGRPR
ncbi:coiled-coil domain-containing protein 34-like isoform X2 [Anneissia japonica]|uniref:coiled-coil domain-containing protein 34-like isoform X2 n=1 Tax=Anneissia japonica TaxID=1529436 RepID=UPI0014256B2D|nr:coiled-coil domain-containing protein 34-like isoform X2 [Anneissia japonica]